MMFDCRNSIFRATWIKAATRLYKRTDNILIKLDGKAYYFSHDSGNLSHTWLTLEIIAEFVFFSRPRRLKTIMSIAGNFLVRKSSRKIRFTRFRSWALATVFFEMANPRRAWFKRLLRYKNINSAITIFFACLKTAS